MSLPPMRTDFLSACSSAIEAFGNTCSSQGVCFRGKLVQSISVHCLYCCIQVAASNLRFGDGVTLEVGMDLKNMKARKVGVFTDPNVANLLPMKNVGDLSFSCSKIDESRPLLRWNLNRIFRSNCTTKWWQSLPKKAGGMLLPGPGNTTSATFSRVFSFVLSTGYLLPCSVGGGSVIDTAKAANLFAF